MLFLDIYFEGYSFHFWTQIGRILYLGALFPISYLWNGWREPLLNMANQLRYISSADFPHMVKFGSPVSDMKSESQFNWPWLHLKSLDLLTSWLKSNTRQKDSLLHERKALTQLAIRDFALIQDDWCFKMNWCLTRCISSLVLSRINSQHVALTLVNSPCSTRTLPGSLWVRTSIQKWRWRETRPFSQW